MAKKRTINEYRQSKEYGYVNPKKEHETTKIQNRQNNAESNHKMGDEEGRKKKQKDPQSLNQVLAELGGQVLLLRRMYPNNYEFGAKVGEMINRKMHQIGTAETNL